MYSFTFAHSTTNFLFLKKLKILVKSISKYCTCKHLIFTLKDLTFFSLFYEGAGTGNILLYKALEADLALLVIGVTYSSS